MPETTKQIETPAEAAAALDLIAAALFGEPVTAGAPSAIREGR